MRGLILGAVLGVGVAALGAAGLLISVLAELSEALEVTL